MYPGLRCAASLLNTGASGLYPTCMPMPVRPVCLLPPRLSSLELTLVPGLVHLLPALLSAPLSRGPPRERPPENSEFRPPTTSSSPFPVSGTVIQLVILTENLDARDCSSFPGPERARAVSPTAGQAQSPSSRITAAPPAATATAVFSLLR